MSVGNWQGKTEVEENRTKLVLPGKKCPKTFERKEQLDLFRCINAT
jgi:hypothetical protein